MPLYEYKCVKCGHRFEKIESVSAATTKKCPKCGAKAERQLSAPAIQFKGTGWYVTDYAGKKPDSSSERKFGRRRLFERQGKVRRLEVVGVEVFRLQILRLVQKLGKLGVFVREGNGKKEKVAGLFFLDK